MRSCDFCSSIAQWRVIGPDDRKLFVCGPCKAKMEAETAHLPSIEKKGRIFPSADPATCTCGHVKDIRKPVAVDCRFCSGVVSIQLVRPYRFTFVGMVPHGASDTKH